MTKDESPLNSPQSQLEQHNWQSLPPEDNSEHDGKKIIIPDERIEKNCKSLSFRWMKIH